MSKSNLDSFFISMELFTFIRSPKVRYSINIIRSRYLRELMRTICGRESPGCFTKTMPCPFRLICKGVPCEIRYHRVGPTLQTRPTWLPVAFFYFLRSHRSLRGQDFSVEAAKGKVTEYGSTRKVH